MSIVNLASSLPKKKRKKKKVMEATDTVHRSLFSLSLNAPITTKHTLRKRWSSVCSNVFAAFYLHLCYMLQSIKTP